ncbi:MAG: hypothetical protein WCF12_05450 [Propionicimonas sp.]
MTITTTKLTRWAGLCAVVAGLLFIAVQINHPPLDLALVTTAEWTVRQSMKVLMTVLALAGITGMYLSQVRKAGVLGLLGYLIFGVGYLAMMTIEVAALVILPAIASSAPGYVSDVLAVATGGTATGDIGLFPALSLHSGIGYMAGGLVFGIALFRANVLARWAAVLLAVATTATMAIPLLPWINQRLFAVPTGVALIGLGYSLWRSQRSRAEASVSEAVSAPLQPAVSQ